MASEALGEGRRTRRDEALQRRVVGNPRVGQDEGAESWAGLGPAGAEDDLGEVRRNRDGGRQRRRADDLVANAPLAVALLLREVCETSAQQSITATCKAVL